MNDLVFLKNDEAVCTSLQVADKFHKQHKDVLRRIDNIVAQNYATEKWFKFANYKANDNQQHRICYMNRDGFSLLVMGFSGKKALEWKVQYINAFNQMESMLKERNTQLWIEQRKQGKLTRNSETDVIKTLVEYAKEQGSKHSEMLYMTYSKLANKMAGISDRDTASIMQLNELSFIENIILNQIRVGIERGMHYKDIYKDCKRQIELFKDIAYLNVG